MKFSPQHSDVRMRAIYASLIVSSFVLMSVGTGIVKTVLLSLAVVCLGVGITLFIKCDMTTYTYIVLDREKGLDFYVDRANGKRSAYVCYYPLSDAIALEKYEKGTRKALRQRFGKSFFYHYSHNRFCCDRYVLVFKNEGYCDCVICQLDKESYDFLKGAISVPENNAEKNV